jgi:hypothetical protein
MVVEIQYEQAMEPSEGNAPLPNTGLNAGTSVGAGKDVHIEPLNSPPSGLKPLDQRVRSTAHGSVDRILKSCDSCRKMKVRCDGDHPCKHCTKFFYGESSSAFLTCS